MVVEFRPLLPHRHRDMLRYDLRCRQASIGEGAAGLVLTTGSPLAADLGNAGAEGKLSERRPCRKCTPGAYALGLLMAGIDLIA